MSITEGTQPAPVTWTGAWTTAQTTASFTPESGALLVALLSGDGLGSGTPATGSITDSLSGTWTLLKRQNANDGTVGGLAEVWCRDSPGTSLTVSATESSTGAANGGQLAVRTLIGAKAAAQQNGATGGVLLNTGAVQVSVAAGTGNKIYGAALNWTASTAMTVLGNSADVANFADSTNGDNWAAFKSSGDTAGTAAYGYSTSTQGQIAAVEIIAAPSAAASAALPHIGGKQWRRRFRHRQQLLAPPAAVVAPVSGPPVYPLTGPVGLGRRQPVALGGSAGGSAGLFAQAGPPFPGLDGPVRTRPQPPPRGRTAWNRGVRHQAGPPFPAADGPVQARRPLPPRGRCRGLAGTFTAVAPQSGPPVYPLRGPVRTRPQPPPRGRAAGNRGLFAQQGPPVTPLRGPVCARQPLPRRGRCAGNQGTFTQVVITTGSPVYPLHGPVRTRPQPPPRGRCAGNRGTRSQTGPPVAPLRGPAAAFRPGPYRSGRCQSDPGTFGQAGPKVAPLRGPVRSRVPQRPRGGHTAGGAGTYTFIPPPPFLVARSVATVTGPRDGRATVAALATSLATVTDPRDGTPGVT